MSRKAPYIPFYPADWLSGVADLTPAECGIYVNILMLIYDNGGPIKADVGRLARRMNCPPGSFKAVLASLLDAGKLVQRDGFLTNERAANELEIRSQKGQSASENAKARWSKNPRETETGDMRPHQIRNAIQSQNQIKDTDVSFREGEKSPKPEKSKARGTRLPSDWIPSQADIEAAQGMGLTEQEFRHECAKFRDYWISKTGSGATKADWGATWRNWCRRVVETRGRAQAGNATGRGHGSKPRSIAAVALQRRQEASQSGAAWGAGYRAGAGEAGGDGPSLRVIDGGSGFSGLDDTPGW